MTTISATTRVTTITANGQSVTSVVAASPTVSAVVTARGLPGPTFDGSGVLTVNNRLAEFDEPEAKAEARANLGLDDFPDFTLIYENGLA